jgi:hypothetical protein
MSRKFAGAVVVVILVAGLSLAAKDSKRAKGKSKHPRGKITKVEGSKITVAVGRRGATTDKTYTLTPTTKYVSHNGKEKKELKADEAKGLLKAGTRVRIEADDKGNVQTLHFGKGKKAKKTKNPK